jgi:hypothetical protein
MPFENNGDYGIRSYPLLWHINARVIAGNAIAATISNTSRFNHTAKQTNDANGDTFEHDIFLMAGVYNFVVVGTTDAAMGRLDWYLDGTKIVSLQDWYAAAPVENVSQTTSVTVSESGYHRLVGKVNGHNAAPATDYEIPLIYYRFTATA